MERLINHLQQALDDDEIAKDALLMLRNGRDGSSNPVLASDKNSSSSLKSAQEDTSERTLLIEESSNIFILQGITARILKDSVLPIDLPIKIAAMHLDISPKLIRDLCATQTLYASWGVKFTTCFNQIMDIHEWLIFNNRLIASEAQVRKLRYLRHEMLQLEQAPYGAGMTAITNITYAYFEHPPVIFLLLSSCLSYTVARFILNTIVDFINVRALPLPLSTGGGVALPPLATKELDLRELVVNPTYLQYRHSAVSPAVQQAGEEELGMKVILLAPLVTRPRCPKHL